ncbi:MAG: response regulator [Acidobacteria bacterium]|nr:response regulator [Acidobacteriota bacterium]
MKDSDGRPATILIVEDIDWIRYGMKKSVERQGYRAAQATDDAEAFEVAERESIELILTEEKLPAFDALMARLREHPALSKVPVVIINPDAEEGARHGDAYLLTDYARISSLLAGLRR